MPDPRPMQGWMDQPPVRPPPADREAHVRNCSLFADELLNRYPDWLDGLDDRRPPIVEELQSEIADHGLERGLRLYRNRNMLRIIWQDLCGLVPLKDIFSDLTALAEICLQTTVEHCSGQLIERFGVPRDENGEPQQLIVIGMGKFGGGELNLSSDIDVMFCYPRAGMCDGRKGLANDQFFIRLSRAVIAALSERTGDGFCFRVDARLRPFGDSGPLAVSVASMEQYYQNEGRAWERYAMIKARPVAGDLQAGARLLENLRPFVYRRYIDFGSVESMQQMHASVQEDARRKDRLDDIKRGPGGIREIEFLAQCFQILRGGREPSLQTPSLDRALRQVGALHLLPTEVLEQLRSDYQYLRRLENRIQALRDQQTHRLPEDAGDMLRLAQAMGHDSPEPLRERLGQVRQRVSGQFEQIFPEQPASDPGDPWSERWRQMQAGRQDDDPTPELPEEDALARFVRRLHRLVLSQRAEERLNRFMPALLSQLDRTPLSETSLERVFDLVLTICRRSAYLVLMVQHRRALSRVLDLFARSDWIADQVIRFPALLDELIDPSLGRQIPGLADLADGVERLLDPAQGTEASLAGLNYLKLATSLRIAVAQLESGLEATAVQQALTDLADALLEGVLRLASFELEQRHGRPVPDEEAHRASNEPPAMAIVGYGTLGARELGYRSDLDIVFLFDTDAGESDGKRPLPPERYFTRLAQRVLSYLTAMTPSGRLYEVDTRLRPNGRAGALVSSIRAFRQYQLTEAWTWEMQALTRARVVVGPRSLRGAFERIRRDALCRERPLPELERELREMRDKMRSERTGPAQDSAADRLKYAAGGLVDIEFVVQMGILSSAARFPSLLRATGTRQQIGELEQIDWLSAEEARTLERTWVELCRARMLTSLLTSEPVEIPATDASDRIYQSRLGDGAQLA